MAQICGYSFAAATRLPEGWCPNLKSTGHNGNGIYLRVKTVLLTSLVCFISLGCERQIGAYANRATVLIVNQPIFRGVRLFESILVGNFTIYINGSLGGPQLGDLSIRQYRPKQEIISADDLWPQDGKRSNSEIQLRREIIQKRELTEIPRQTAIVTRCIHADLGALLLLRLRWIRDVTR